MNKNLRKKIRLFWKWPKEMLDDLWEKIVLKTSWSQLLETKPNTNFGKGSWKAHLIYRLIPVAGMSPRGLLLTNGQPTFIEPLWCWSNHCWPHMARQPSILLLARKAGKKVLDVKMNLASSIMQPEFFPFMYNMPSLPFSWLIPNIWRQPTIL